MASIDSRRLAIAAAFILPFSLLGLLRAMIDGYSNAFVDIWRANLWGDLMFAGGTVAAVLLVWSLQERLQTEGRLEVAAQWAILVPVAFLAGWVVYGLSWAITGNAMFEIIDGSGWSSSLFWGFPLDGESITATWGFTFQWGWLGLAAFAAAAPTLGHFMQENKKPAIAA